MTSTKKRIKEEFRLEGYRSYEKLLSDVKRDFGENGEENIQIKKEEYKKGFLFKKTYYNAIVRVLEDDLESSKDLAILKLIDEIKNIKTEIADSKKSNSQSQILEQMRYEMKNMAHTIDSLQDKNNYTKEVKKLQKFLSNQNVEEDTANKIIKGVIYSCSKDELENLNKVFSCAREQVSTFFRNVKGLDFRSRTQKIIMLVGPTGVGKTTTITKLATYLKQGKSKNVGIITLDTYREGAISQLKDLCDYTNIEVSVAHTKDDFKKALENFNNKEYVFIDTAGRSPYDLSEIRKLYATTNDGNIDEVYLVLSSSTKYNDMLSIYENYKSLNVNRVIFSKIDETKEYGNILSFVDTVNSVPLSYLTTGQEVPNDIEKVRETRMVELLFKKDESMYNM